MVCSTLEMLINTGTCVLSDTYVLTDPQALNALGPVQTYLAAMPVYSKLTHYSGTPFYPNPLGPVCVNNSAR